jgi:hypothetical protein
MRGILAVFLLGSLFITSQSWAQDGALQRLIQGKKYFWEAKFTRAATSLKSVVGIKGVKREHRYEAYLYLGFVLMRQNATSTEVNSAFEQAVKLNPKREVDTTVIPPDLATRFNRVRDNLVGCVYVTSDPPDVEFVVLHEDSILYNVTTPALLCELTNRTYELLVAEDGYEEQFMTLPFAAASLDSVEVTLVPEQSSGRGSKKMLTWFARGGIVATAAAVIYKTILQSKNEGNVENLPGPPARP